jgi:hypothetical protein
MNRTSAHTGTVALLTAVVVASVAVGGCSKRESASLSAPMSAPMATSTSAPGDALTGGSGNDESARDHKDPAPATQTQRRIVRKAELSLESDAPDKLQSELTALASSKGGFVVGADTTRSRGEDGAESIDTTVTFRVPAAQFDATLSSVHALARRVASEKVTGEDVTEEYVDLEARIRARRALEDQYMTILKEAKSIPDILAVEQKLGDVRSEIERSLGRRRFLENQSDLSTFTVHVSRQIAAVDNQGPGFGRSVKAAVRDSVDVSIAIVNGLIRALGVAIPLLVILILPIYLLLRWWWRGRRRNQG